MTTIKVALIEDHRVVREGLRALLESQPDIEIVGEAGDGPSALHMVSNTRPAVAVVDIGLPRVQGSQLISSLLRIDPSIAILVLTAHEESAVLREMLAAGVRGYALKRSAAPELLRAIRAVAAGGVYVDPTLGPEALWKLLSDHRREGATTGLTAREEEVLRLIARGHSNREIAERLDLSVKTIETHRARAQVKLGIHSRAGIVQYALESGWLSEAGPT